jgi:hypothetical protein
MKKLGEDSIFYYSANRSFLYPQNELEKIKGKYMGKKFFEEIFNEETREFEGGYYPDREKYQVDDRGNLKYDREGKPMLEEGWIKRNIKKVPKVIKDLTLPGSPISMKTPPLETPDVNPALMSQVLPSSNVMETGLTATEQALLSDEEKGIRLRQRGMTT